MVRYIRRLLRRDEHGQSLAETALVLPILILILAGVVEVSHMALTQNKLNTAARAGARFGANGGEDAGILQTTIWAITTTEPVQEHRWDIWVVRGEVDEMREIPEDQFSFDHVFGLGLTEKYSETNTVTFTNQLRLQIQTQLQLDEDNDSDADSSGLKFVGVYALHDVQSILGIDLLPNLVGLNTMRGFSVMRRAALAASVEQTSGCRGLFPLAIEQGVRTVTQAEYETNVYPTFTHPTGINRPEWEDFTRQPQAGSTASLLEGKEGYVYHLNFSTSFSAQSFDWLKWNTYIQSVTSGSILQQSLLWPGNSDDYDPHPGDLPSAPPPDWPNTYRGYAEVGDPTDKQLHRGDFIAQDPFGFNQFGVTNALITHVDLERSLRMVLWDASGGSGSGQYNASGFAVFKILGYSTDNWMLLQLVRIDNSCGQIVN